MKFLIIKTSSLGDIVQSFSVLSYLKFRFPDCQIDWIVEAPFAELVRAHPHVNRTLCIRTKVWRKAPWNYIEEMRLFRKNLREIEYDVVFDLQGNVKSGLATFQARSKHKVGFARGSVSEWPNILFTNHRYQLPPQQNIREDYLFIVKSYFQDFSPFSSQGLSLNITPELQRVTEKILTGLTPPIVMVCPGSAWRNKQMTESALIDFLKLLQVKLQCHFLLIWGSEDEKKIAERIVQNLSQHAQIVDRLPLPALQNLMNQVDLVVAMDSLPLHLAGTTSTPTFSVFGASSARKYQPAGENHHALQGACPYGRTFDKRCPILRSCATGNCIRALTGLDVFKEFCNRHL